MVLLIDVGENKTLKLPEESEFARLLLKGEVLEVLIDDLGYIVVRNPKVFPIEKDAVLKLGMVAKLENFSVTDLLTVVNLTKKSGILEFISEGIRKFLYFNGGEVVYAKSNLVEDRIGLLFVRENKLRFNQLEDVLSRCPSSITIGKFLVLKGFITPKELWDVARLQVEEITYSLFCLEKGIVMFWEGEVSSEQFVKISMPTQNVIVEGVRRLDDWKLLIKSLPKAGSRAMLEGDVELSELSALNEFVLSLIENGKTFEEIVKSSSFGTSETSKVLDYFIRKKIVCFR